MSAIRIWWRELSARERVLVAIMGVLIAIVVIWLGIARPVEGALENARARQVEALDRNVAIRAKVKLLQAMPARTPASASGSLDQIVGQSAGEEGFTLERTQAQGEGRVEIAIASARPTALFGWLAKLEMQGVVVDTLTMQPAATAGTISVRAVLKRAGQ
ncbi:type II secretory protein PulM [Sphingobium sp. SCG-1]|uniref:type II secretion system protein GspM n=1 Tax=Sphingobium sp. SCG-1 TaxID=2072936 RepID=UPI000CD6AFE6|nr:type II secretion system protein M [Sphingobium sp. SCG-1]AUW58694.1 type II secretory protein PulM [Sphingobium sp. SCG-1]